MPYSNLALDADRENGPAARSFAPDAHDRIMVRIKPSYRIQVCSMKMHPNGELPSDPQKIDRHRQKLKLCKKPVSLFIVAPRAQASRRCETQATLGGKAAKLCYRFGPLTPSARSANLIPGDGTKNGFPSSEQRTGKNQKQPLDRKSPIQVQIRLPPAKSPLRTCFEQPTTQRNAAITD